MRSGGFSASPILRMSLTLSRWASVTKRGVRGVRMADEHELSPCEELPASSSKTLLSLDKGDGHPQGPLFQLVW